MAFKNTVYIITCEHAGNRVPKKLDHLFPDAGTILETHRGYDLGALDLAKEIASVLGAPIFYSTITRLVADLNRSVSSRSLFSEFTAFIGKEYKSNILQRYYFPYRRRVEQEITSISTKNRVIHIAVHSFTPELKGVERNAEIGFLYDPGKALEKEFCFVWKKELEKRLPPDFRIRMNYPYKGISDSLPLKLRKTLPADAYAGIEIEINQAVFKDESKVYELKKAIPGSLLQIRDKI